MGLVLADSSIVTLALPEMLRRLETTVLGVSWVLPGVVVARLFRRCDRIERRSEIG